MSQSMSLEAESHRPMVPSAPLVAWVPRRLLYEYVTQLKPRVLCAQVVVRGGSADVQISVAQLVGEKASLWVETWHGS